MQMSYNNNPPNSSFPPTFNHDEVLYQFWLQKFTKESSLYAHYKMLLRNAKNSSNASINSNVSFYQRCVAASRRRRNFAQKKVKEFSNNNKPQNKEE